MPYQMVRHGTLMFLVLVSKTMELKNVIIIEWTTDEAKRFA